jgi:hypothetical protein
VQGQTNAVIRHAILRIIVRPNLLRSFRRPHHRPSLRTQGILLTLDFDIEQPAFQNSRVTWRGVTRTWNIEREMDRRGNTIGYDYANLTDGAKEPTTRESAIRRIAYTGFVDANGNETLGDQAIDFQYETDDRYGKLFYEGEEVSRKMRLFKIVTQSKGIDVRSYRLAYEADPMTNTALPIETAVHSSYRQSLRYF